MTIGDLPNLSYEVTLGCVVVVVVVVETHWVLERRYLVDPYSTFIARWLWCEIRTAAISSILGLMRDVPSLIFMFSTPIRFVRLRDCVRSLLFWWI